ncbi:hypothetical protein ABE61_22645 [Lysinibacillus sphaericus]|uniref:DUF2577 family protein n=1 Tax=Lysinibacillus sphaericus TaxID=1421 RepID=UPI0018CEE350|nr:DUF2577 family protein [Lysinibacillus sphaericus]MBG9456732.1 hypothetical protein [Lysinibacillus sphaericus]MBG9476896.1 hypothetical protein [Lysinibacillus sphaericus]MBG9591445.1 hypothetical protein [Lysinibacillus sphaericus]
MATKPAIPKEGSGSSRLIGSIRAVGYNAGGTLKAATITSEHPNLKVLLDVDTLEIDDDIIICNPHLLPYTETVRINGQEATIEYDSKLKAGVRVLVFEPEHQQQLYVLSLSDK